MCPKVVKTEEYYLRRISAGLFYTQTRNLAETEQLFLLNRGIIKYWARKLQDKNFHSGEHGGLRHNSFKYGVKTAIRARVALYELVQFDPTKTTAEYQSLLASHGFEYSSSWISKTFSEWNYSYHSIEHRHMDKFKTENVFYYFDYCQSLIALLSNTYISKLKFVDECHIVSKGVSKQKGVGPKGKRIVFTSPQDLDDRVSITLMTCLDRSFPLFWNFTQETNDQYSFLKFILEAIEGNYLKCGDYLVMDNASLHFGSDIRQTLIDVLEANNISLTFLPTYSPELNPCELVFAFMKNYLRRHRNHQIPLLQSIIETLGKLSFGNVWDMYNHCVFKEHIIMK